MAGRTGSARVAAAVERRPTVLAAAGVGAGMARGVTARLADKAPARVGGSGLGGDT